MKINNLCVGKRPPVIRMLSGERKVVCYELRSGRCEPDQLETNNPIVLYITNKVRPNECKDPSATNGPIVLYITNIVRPNECKYTFPLQPLALCRVYSDNFSSTWREIVQNDKLKVELPQLTKGYYYLEVTYEGSKNVTMLNIL